MIQVEICSVENGYVVEVAYSKLIFIFKTLPEALDKTGKIIEELEKQESGGKA